MSIFNKGKIGRNLFGQNSSLKNGEPSLRDEVKRIIHEEKRGSWLVYRRMRRDNNGLPILSSAAESNRSSESLFKNNEGMKYLFDDHIIKGYISLDQSYHDPGKIIAPGDSRTDNRCIYLEYDILSKITQNLFDMPDAHDKIITPVYNIEGKLKSPLEIKELYHIGSVEPYRLDNTGRVEFFKINILSDFNNSHRL